MSVTSFDKGANQTSKHKEVTPMLHGNERIVKHKIGLLNLAEELTNVSRACKIMGLSRDTFYRYKAAVGNGGIDALVDKNRRKPNIKNRVDEVTEGCCHRLCCRVTGSWSGEGQQRAEKTRDLRFSKRGPVRVVTPSTGSIQRPIESPGREDGTGSSDSH